MPMPRKKDGMLVELHPRPTKGEDGKPLLYPKPAMKHTWSMSYLDEYCSKYRGMSRGELTRALEALLDVASYLMADGSRVETPLGTFGPKLKLDGDFTDPDVVKGSNISFSDVDFIPSKRFVMETGENILYGFRKYVDPSKKETLSEDEQRLEVLRQLTRKRGVVTITSFAYNCGIKYSTAREWLNRHCKGESPSVSFFRDGHQLYYRTIEPEQQ